MLLTANIFQPLISVFASVIKFFHDDVSLSWGWSIVLLTICVRLVLVPLTAKQFNSMRKLQHLQPQMKVIQTKYKQDKQRQQEEMMKFYRENDVNPFASCLPLVAQLPVFISLFYMLRKNLRGDICPAIQRKFQAAYANDYVNGGHVSGVTVAAHAGATKATAHAAALGQTIQCGHVTGAGFLFIKDITNQATGITLVVLLVLYVGTQVMSTLLMSTPTMDKNQRNLMMIMLLAFVLFIIRFPAGLIVYWITTNTWTMAQQYTLKRLMGPPPPAVAVDLDIAGPSPRRGRGGSAGVTPTPPPPSTGGSGGSGNGGGMGKVLRGLAGARNGDGDPPPAAKASGNGSGGRPPSARKKRKRSGRRR